MSFGCFENLCSLGFFKSSDLRKTSLNRAPYVEPHPQKSMPETESSLTKHELKSPRKPPHKRDVESLTHLDKQKKPLTERDFRILQILKSGKDWKTYMVRKEDSDCVYAMKLIGKKKMTQSCFIDQVTMEREILEKAKHPFIPKLAWYFENEKKIFFVMEFVEGGGTLHNSLKQLSRFSEEITRFYSAEILLILEYLHMELKVAYGDIKLRNFLLDTQGHIKLIDYSKAKRLVAQEADKEDAEGKFSEQLRKVGPEMTDLFRLGCLIYKLLTGKSPNKKKVHEKLTEKDLDQTSHLNWPCPVSKNAKDIITRLLNRSNDDKPAFSSIDEIKKHPFFAQINWEKMLNKSVYPPLIPLQFDEYDKEFEEPEDDKVETTPQKPGLEKIQEDALEYSSIEEGNEEGEDYEESSSGETIYADSGSDNKEDKEDKEDSQKKDQKDIWSF